VCVWKYCGGDKSSDNTNGIAIHVARKFISDFRSVRPGTSCDRRRLERQWYTYINIKIQYTISYFFNRKHRPYLSANSVDKFRFLMVFIVRDVLIRCPVLFYMFLSGVVTRQIWTSPPRRGVPSRENNKTSAANRLWIHEWVSAKKQVYNVAQ